MSHQDLFERMEFPVLGKAIDRVKLQEMGFPRKTKEK
jgi:hypothetical protein